MRIKSFFSCFLSICLLLNTFSLTAFASDINNYQEKYSVGDYYNIYFGERFQNEIQPFEEAVTAAYEEMDLNSKDYFHKLLTIYQWLSTNIHYNLPDEYGTKHSQLYWAMVEHQATCAGFSSMFHFLCLNAGLKNVEGVDGFNGQLAHGWNIVKFGDLWYVVDASSSSGYSHGDFMTTYNYIGYKRNDKYLTNDYVKNHPMASEPLNLYNYGVSNAVTNTNDFNLTCKQICGTNKVVLSWQMPDYMQTVKLFEVHKFYGRTYKTDLGTFGIGDEPNYVTNISSNLTFFNHNDNINSITFDLNSTSSFVIRGYGEYFKIYESPEVNAQIPTVPSDHTFINKEIKNSTCTQNGYIKQVCSVCDYEKTTSIKATGHNYSVFVSEVLPSCISDGYRITKCLNCDNTNVETLESLGHIYDSYISKLDPTCESAGYTTKHCVTCDNYITTTYPAIGHNFEKKDFTAATDKTDGNYILKCSNCNKIEDTVIINKVSTIKLEKTEYDYTGKNIKPSIVVCDSSGKNLVINKDYKIVYPSNCKAVNEYSVTINLINNYNGSITKKYKIKGKISKGTLTTKKTYTGNTIKPVPTVYGNDNKKLDKSSYAITYPKSSWNIGEYYMTVRGKGLYGGSVNVKYEIVPKNISKFSLSKGKKSFKVNWKKQTTKTTGYQIQYSTNKNFAKDNKTITIKNNKTTAKTIKNLKSKKTYYVHVRTYKTVTVNKKTKKIYSSWSAKKSVKTK